MAINRYDQAQPAQDNYFSTFVPLPLDQLTAMGAARKQELDKNQALMDQAYDEALDINYIKESPKEEANYRAITKAITDLSMEFTTKDVSQPLVFNEMKRKLRKAADPALIKRMEQSAVAHDQYKALEMDMRAKNQWSDELNRSTASLHDSQMGVYNELPTAYMGRKATFGQYFDDLPTSFKGIDPRGFMVHGVDDEDIDRIANERASTIAATPGGKAEIKIYRGQYPDVAEGKSNEEIINIIARDYAQKEIQDQYTALPKHLLDMYMTDQDGTGDQIQPTVGPGRNLNPDASGRTLYKDDVKQLEKLNNQITEIDKQIGIEKNKDTKLYLEAQKSGLIDRQNQINSAIDHAKRQTDPEYDIKKENIISNFVDKLSVKGINEEDSTAMLEYFQKDNGIISVEEIARFNNALSRGPESLLNLLGDIAGFPFAWGESVIDFYGNAVKSGFNLKKIFSPDVKQDVKDNFNKWMSHDYKISKNPLKDVIQAADALANLDRKTEKKVKESYKEYADKATQDVQYITFGSAITDSKTSATLTTKEGKAKVPNTSSRLRDFKLRGGSYAELSEEGDSGIKPFRKIEDLQQFVRSSDEIGLVRFDPSIDEYGDYNIVVAAKRDRIDNKNPEETRLVNIKLNKMKDEVNTMGWINDIASDLTAEGQGAHARRLRDSSIELELMAHKHDKNFSIVLDKSNPDEKFNVTKIDDDEYMVETPDGDFYGRLDPITYEQVLATLYEHKYTRK